ncbi:DUF6531 domain-containing protein [Streptomyces sp. NPDC047108]|uniref:DUF6531 domain-containing protein n=1 Tax=Streptomyces sp. NPDC047108 TaxID=3155025 RepID=UPI00340A9854
MLDLNEDPVPGDPERVRGLARRLHDFADDVAGALRLIKGMAGDDALLKWAGKSADAFTEEFEEVPKNLGKLRRSYEIAGDALSTYWPLLQQAQGDSLRALEKGRTAKHDLTAAHRRLENANAWVDRASKKAKEYEDNSKKLDHPRPDENQVRAATRNATEAKSSRTSAESDVDGAQSALDAAKKMAADARKLREDAASACKKKLEEASDAGIQNRSWWEDAVDWVSDNWDTIVAVCKVVVAIVGIIAMIIGGPILAAIVVVAALVVLADTINKYLKGQATLLDVAFAALDCIPGGRGITSIGKLAKGIKAASKGGLKAMAKGLGKGGLRRNAGDTVATSKQAKGRCKNGDPVDMVSGEMIMDEVDVELPGLLPLTLRRTHLSTYRSGRSFGESWASTLDERLELDEEGAVFAVEDGMILIYPIPEPGTSVMPLEGPRWPLDWDGSPDAPIRITDPTTGYTRHFAPLGVPTPTDEAFTLPLSALTDRDGRRIDFERDEKGVPILVRDSGGRIIRVDTEEGRVTGLCLHNPEGSPEGAMLVRYAYDADGDLAEVINSSGLPFRYTYDNRSRMTSWTDRNGSWYRFRYDDEDRCIQGEGADGFLSCTITYDSENRETRYIDSLGHTTTYRYNEHRQVVAQTDPLGHTTYATWDPYNRLLSRTDPLGHTSRFTYDGRGNLSSVTRPDGSVTTVRYDADDRPSEITLPTGATRRYAYNEHGRTTEAIDPSGATTRFSYDSAGGLHQVTNALGATHHVVCDPLGLPVASTAPMGNTTRLRRDAFGRIVESTDADGSTTCTAWTVEGKFAHREFSDGTSESWLYDGEGNTLRYAGVDGQVVSHSFTHFDLPRTRTEADGSIVYFTYDTELRLTSVTGATGAVWSYTYDPAGRLVREVDFNGRTVAYAYDAAGRLTQRTNGAGECTTFIRDARGRVVERHSGDSVTTFSYDAEGRLIRAVTPETSLVITRDMAGRVVLENCNGRTVHSTYDALGRRIERRTPSGATSHWDWDENNRPTQVRIADNSLGFNYGVSGHEVVRQLGELTVLRQEWDAGHRLTSQVVTAPQTDEGESSARSVVERSYAYGQDGRLASVEDGATGRRRLALDRVGRVESVTAHAWTERYAYDAFGNVSSAEAPTGPQGERIYDGTLVRRAGHVTYVHDAQGRLVRQTRKLLSGGSLDWSYTWDAEDRLVAITTPDGRSWEYMYDGLGRRVGKRLRSDDGRTLEESAFVWDGSHLAEESSSAGTTSWDWAPGTNRAILQLDQNEVDRRFYAIVTDVVGTPTELIDMEGRIAWRARTTLWGSAVPTARETTAVVQCPLRFPGQYHDAESGLHYNFRRYYDPDNARYISPDPLGLAPAANHHSYVFNPLHWTDPWGLISCEGNHGITERRENHIEGQHGPGAQDRVRENADPTDPAPQIPGEFHDDFLWDGDDFALGRRLQEGIDGTPALPNPRARAGQDSHLHRFDHGSPVGINGSGRETSVVEVVIRDGNIHTAYPI